MTPRLCSLRALQTTENLILQKGNVPKDQLRTYVVWPGVLYGCGEGALHPLFKAGWKGEQPVLPVLDGGKTVLPMIHVRDLAAIVVRISEKKPEQKEYAERFPRCIFVTSCTCTSPSMTGAASKPTLSRPSPPRCRTAP